LRQRAEIRGVPISGVRLSPAARRDGLENARFENAFTVGHALGPCDKGGSISPNVGAPSMRKSRLAELANSSRGERSGDAPRSFIDRNSAPVFARRVKSGRR